MRRVTRGSIRRTLVKDRAMGGLAGSQCGVPVPNPPIGPTIYRHGLLLRAIATGARQCRRTTSGRLTSRSVPRRFEQGDDTLAEDSGIDPSLFEDVEQYPSLDRRSVGTIARSRRPERDWRILKRWSPSRVAWTTPMDWEGLRRAPGPVSRTKTGGISMRRRSAATPLMPSRGMRVPYSRIGTRPGSLASAGSVCRSAAVRTAVRTGA